MTIFEHLQVNIQNSRPDHREVVASVRSRNAMNGLVDKALKKTSLNRGQRKAWIAAALGLEELETTKTLTQAQVSTLIDFLLQPDNGWDLKEGIEPDISAIEREVLRRIGQIEMRLA